VGSVLAVDLFPLDLKIQEKCRLQCFAVAAWLLQHDSFTNRKKHINTKEWLLADNKKFEPVLSFKSKNAYFSVIMVKLILADQCS